MATKSILKNVNISGRKNVRLFVNALEKAQKTTGKEIVMSRPVEELRGQQAEEYLKGYR